MTRLNIGDEVSISVGLLGAIIHKGICTSPTLFTREPMITHNSKEAGRVTEVPLSRFTGGKPIKIKKRATDLTPTQIRNRAYQRLNKPYNVFLYNCEDFVSDVLGLKEGSPQREFLIGGALVVGFLYVITKSRSA